MNYGVYGVVDPDVAGQRYALGFWWYQFALGKIGGWKYYYSRVSSPVSLKLLVRLGAEVLGEVDVVGSEGKQKMWMIRIDLRKPFFTYKDMVIHLTKKKGNKPREDKKGEDGKVKPKL